MPALRYTPVTRHRPPIYPTKLDVLLTPDLLTARLPRAWRARKELIGAAALFGSSGMLADLTGCLPPFVTPGIPAAIPVVCLSETDAIQVIRDELSRQGLTLSEENVELVAVQIPDYSGAPGTLAVDLADPRHTVAIEYIGQADYWTYAWSSPGGTLSVTDVADRIFDLAAEQMPDLYLGVFHTQPDAAGNCAADAAESDLREQVRDFVDWLKAQGVI